MESTHRKAIRVILKKYYEEWSNRSSMTFEQYEWLANTDGGFLIDVIYPTIEKCMDIAMKTTYLKSKLNESGPKNKRNSKTKS
jgi:hypothetical protein